MILGDVSFNLRSSPPCSATRTTEVVTTITLAIRHHSQLAGLFMKLALGNACRLPLRTWLSSVHLITDTDLVSLNNYQISFEQRGKGKLRIIYTPQSRVVFSSCIFLQNSCGKRLNQRSTCRSMSLHMRVGG
jgi:hypothetical protein